MNEEAIREGREAGLLFWWREFQYDEEDGLTEFPTEDMLEECDLQLDFEEIAKLKEIW